MRVQGVARLGHRAAEDAPVARADRVLVLEVGAQRVRRPVDFAALGAGPRIRRPHPQYVDAAPARHCKIKEKIMIVMVNHPLLSLSSL